MFKTQKLCGARLPKLKVGRKNWPYFFDFLTLLLNSFLKIINSIYQINIEFGKSKNGHIQPSNILLEFNLMFLPTNATDIF